MHSRICSLHFLQRLAWDNFIDLCESWNLSNLKWGERKKNLKLRRLVEQSQSTKERVSAIYEVDLYVTRCLHNIISRPDVVVKNSKSKNAILPCFFSLMFAMWSPEENHCPWDFIPHCIDKRECDGPTWRTLCKKIHEYFCLLPRSQNTQLGIWLNTWRITSRLLPQHSSIRINSTAVTGSLLYLLSGSKWKSSRLTYYQVEAYRGKFETLMCSRGNSTISQWSSVYESKRRETNTSELTYSLNQGWELLEMLLIFIV